MARTKKENEVEVVEETDNVKRVQNLRNLINKKAGDVCAYNLNEENPTLVKDWIPTGSRLLDSIICAGQMAGIPVGKVTELAGVESSGKSYMAIQIAANAMKKDIDVVYFDSESAIDPDFIERLGVNVENFVYTQAKSIEFMFETIEDILGSSKRRTLFILDSLAMCPCESDISSDFDPLSSIAAKARVMAKGLSKIIIPLANHQSTFLILNQLKTNITTSVAEKFTTPFNVPGGKAPTYAYSLRIWLTASKAKASYVKDEDEENNIGSSVKAKIKKSRFGTLGRECEFQILWGGEGEIGILDKESWFDAIKRSDQVSVGGAWCSLKYEDGTEEKYQENSWLEKLKDKKFYDRVVELLDKILIK